MEFGEEYDDTDEGWEDSEKCGEEKIDAILNTVFDKLDDSCDDEAYKERLCNFLGSFNKEVNFDVILTHNHVV
ncbi:hypothetical protein Tco_1182179 [Tanacetum coccineum]